MKDRTAPRQPIRTLRPASEPLSFVEESAVTSASAPVAARPSPSGAGAIRTILLELVDDSPYQPRLAYDPEKIDELAKGLAAVGQQEAIIVRELPNGRYELISGHRRKRAAISIGWVDIEARVVHYSEKEAEKATLIQNEGRSDLTDFERAKIYKLALTHGLVKNQTECADLFSNNQSTVSRCLSMLDLPAPIIDLLERQPDLFGFNTAVIIRDLIKQYPDQVELITKGVERLKDGAEANSLRGWVAQMLASGGKEPVARTHSVIANASGAPKYETRVKFAQRQVVLSLKDTREDLAAFDKWLVGALRKRSDGAE